MALVLTALVGLTLSGLARHSLMIAAEAQAAKSDLQRRWGTIFVSRILLADPEQFVADPLDEDDTRERSFPLSATLSLGEVTFHLTLDDENRKININRLRVTAGTRRVRDLLYRSAGGTTEVELCPAQDRTLSTREFDSWGQVVRFRPTDSVEQHLDQVRPLSQVITCWGNARVNLSRCSDAVLHEVGHVAAGPIAANHLVALRESEPQLSKDELLTQLATDRRKRALLQGWLTDESSCFSLWILATERHSTLDLFVAEGAGSDSNTTRHFRW